MSLCEWRTFFVVVIVAGHGAGDVVDGGGGDVLAQWVVAGGAIRRWQRYPLDRLGYRSGETVALMNLVVAI